MKSPKRTLKSGQRGQALVLVTISIPVVFGLLALVVDAGWAYWRKEACKTAADAAAMAAAGAAYNAPNKTCGSGVQCQADTACPASPASPASNNLMAACLYAKANGFVSSGKQTVTVAGNTTSAPVSGVSPKYWVSVTVSESIPTLFSSILGQTGILVKAQSTAGVFQESGGCVYVLSSINTNATGISNTGNAVLHTGCGVYVDSTSSQAVSLTGNAGIDAQNGATVNIVGGWRTTGNAYITPMPTQGPSTPDPLASLQPPSDGTCNSSGKSLTSSQTWEFDQTQNVICGPISLSGQSSVTFDPGIYVISGGISMTGQTKLSGAGVMLYLKTGSITMSGGATITLSAPTSGTYQGVVIYQDRSNSSDADLTGGSSEILNGVLYLPKASLRYTGGSNANGTTTTIICDTLTMTGDSFINNPATTQFSGPSGAYLIQ